MLRSAARPLGLLALPLALLFAACAAPAPADTVVVDTSTPTTMEPTVAANGVCPENFYTPLESTRQNFSLAAEYYRNANSAEEENIDARLDAFCASEVYLTWLVENDPLFTGGDPDDRNFLRLANVYEFYSTQVEDEAKKKEFLDESLAMRARGEAAMEAAGVSFDQYTRDLREGYFFYSYADVYEDASQRQYAAFNRAFEAQPDSLEDWYLQQLVNISAEVIEDPMERADYLETLAPSFDDASTQTYIAQLVEFSRTPPSDPSQGVTPDAVADLVAKYQADPQSLTESERRTIFGTANQLPDLITEAGGDPDAIQDTYFDEIVAGSIDQLSASQLYALFRRSYRRGDRTQAEDYFNQAIAKAANNAQRADFYYSRAAAGAGNKSSLYAQALSYQPNHGPTLFAQARDYASGIGRPGSVDGRAAYWCLADRFSNVAATGDPRVASAARRTAAGYNRAGPSRDDYFFKGWSPGQSIRASSGSVSCTTRVR